MTEVGGTSRGNAQNRHDHWGVQYRNELVDNFAKQLEERYIGFPHQNWGFYIIIGKEYLFTYWKGSWADVVEKCPTFFTCKVKCSIHLIQVASCTLLQLFCT